MSFLTTYGKPFHEGIHSYLHQFAQPSFPFISFLLCLPLFLLPVAPIKIFGAMIVMLLCPTALLGIVQNTLWRG